MNNIYLGIDVGSVSVNAVLLDEKGKVIKDSYRRIKEQPAVTLTKSLRGLFDGIPQEKIDGVGITGSGAEALRDVIGAHFVNEIVAQAKAAERFYPHLRTIIDIGGQDSKLILVEYNKASKAMLVSDFAMNAICAAGTGSFLDQQAVRLRVSIEKEFGELALKSKNPPRIAGRCSVFAKTDMIHLQQEGTPVYDIVGGLCFALARSFKSNIGKGKRFAQPIAFQGGVAANKGMIRAFTEVLGLAQGELIVPRYFASMGAIGAGLFSLERDSRFKGIEALEAYIDNFSYKAGGLKPLSERARKTESDRCGGTGETAQGAIHKDAKTVEGYLGVDVGSISTNVVVIDGDGNLLGRRYLRTASRPIEAVREGIREIGRELRDRVKIVGAGTTGSGRYLIGDFIGADIVKNEITSQAAASVKIDSAVDTIFEIGGQDSKYISLENGIVVDFEMNKVCAAGTGSFLEEQAEKLEIRIDKEFGNLALESKCPVALGERCTVFMETDLLHHRQAGSGKSDLVAGLSYSIVRNYLNRVVGQRRIGTNIFFQGAVAFNKGVTAAFEEVLGRPITVPPNNDVTGAIGVALMAIKERTSEKSSFRGWDEISDVDYDVNSFECSGCSNHCEIKRITIKGSKPFYYGSRCDKFNVDTKKVEAAANPFHKREEFFLGAPLTAASFGTRVGIPLALIFHEFYPMWKAFFNELGIEVVLSDKTNKKIISDGLARVVSETCFPIKVAHGHILNLLEKKVDYIFLPIAVSAEKVSEGIEQSFNCPYIQVFSHILRSGIDIEKMGARVLSPIIISGWGKNVTRKSLVRMGKTLGKTAGEIDRAVTSGIKAQSAFNCAIQEEGKRLLNNLPEDKVPVIIVSRPYNGCDTGINMDLPDKLSKLGALPIPMDYLPLKSVDISQEWPNMYWRYGQKILSAAELIRKNSRLQCAYITNFGCGPDSFITRFFREKMKGKPYLEIEVDEHSAAAGLITRCEAFLDSVKGASKSVLPPPKRQKPFFPFISEKVSNRVVYIPRMGNHAFALMSALNARGVDSRVFPKSNEDTLRWGRKFTSGRECYPCILTTGDMIRVTKEKDFDPARAAFFMPATNGPCRFGQYARLQRMVLDELGLDEVPIISLNQGHNLHKQIGVYGKDIFRQIWRGMVAVDVLDKMVRETRPYELRQGASDDAYDKGLREIEKTILSKKSPALAIKRTVELFRKIEVRKEKRPVIGIVGEIYVRTNEFANDSIVRQLETLGAEVYVSPMEEWLFHVNSTLKLHNLIKKNYLGFLGASLAGLVQRIDAQAVARPSRDYLNNGHEPPISRIWKNSEPYLPPWFGEAALGAGKSVDFFQKGLSGVISVMPFTCLPGNITAAVLKRFQEDCGMPTLVVAYDGLEQTTTRTRLEAFVHQAGQRQSKCSQFPVHG